MARQLVKSGVDTGKMAMAGMPQNYEGEAIAAVGAIIGEAFETAHKKKDTVDSQLEEETEIFREVLKEDYTEPDFGTGEEELLEIEEIEEEEDDGWEGPPPPAVSQKPKTYSLDMFQTDFEAKLIKGGTSASEAKDLAIAERGKAEGWLMNTYGTLSPTAEQKKMKSGQTVYNKVQAEYDDMSKQYSANTAVPTKGSTTKGSAGVTVPSKRLMPGQEGSPFNRMAKVFGGNTKRTRIGRPMTNEQTFNKLAGNTNSQLPTNEDQTFVAKQRYMRTPSWASGTAVGAAVEGWNIGVEADNYRAQLQADIKDSQEIEWKGLVEEAKERSVEDQSLLALFDSYKAQYSDAVTNLPPTEREDKLKSILSGVTQIEKAKGQANEIRAKIKEDFNNIAFNMMPDGKTDRLMTFYKGGGTMGFLPDENGDINWVGSSAYGMPTKQSLETLMDPEKGLLNYPKKVDVYGVIDTISDGIEKDKYMREVEGPDGMIRKVPVPMEDLKRELDFEIEQAIQTYGAKSLAANLPAFQGKDAYAKWQAGMKVDSDHPKNSVNILKSNMIEALYHKLGGYMSQETVKAGAGYKSQLRMQEEKNKQENRVDLQNLKNTKPGSNSGSGSGSGSKDGSGDGRTAAQKNADALSENRSLFADNILGIFSEGLDVNKAKAAGEPAYDLAKTIPGVKNAYEEDGFLKITNKNDEVAHQIDLSDYRKAKQKLIEIQAKMKFTPEPAGLRTAQDLAPEKFNAKDYINNFNKNQI